MALPKLNCFRDKRRVRALLYFLTQALFHPGPLTPNTLKPPRENWLHEHIQNAAVVREILHRLGQEAPKLLEGSFFSLKSPIIKTNHK